MTVQLESINLIVIDDCLLVYMSYVSINNAENSRLWLAADISQHMIPQQRIPRKMNILKYLEFQVWKSKSCCKGTCMLEEFKCLFIFWDFWKPHAIQQP